MAAVAQRRAKELASDFSHNGNTERYNENNPLTTEELLEQFNPDNMVQISENAYIDKRSYDALINAGIDPGAQPDEETIKRMDELTKLAEEGLIEVPSLN